MGDEPVERLIENLRRRTTYRKRWAQVETLIIDEISMLSADIWDKLEGEALLRSCSLLPLSQALCVCALQPSLAIFARMSSRSVECNSFCVETFFRFYASVKCLIRMLVLTRAL